MLNLSLHVYMILNWNAHSVTKVIGYQHLSHNCQYLCFLASKWFDCVRCPHVGHVLNQSSFKKKKIQNQICAYGIPPWTALVPVSCLKTRVGQWLDHMWGRGCCKRPYSKMFGLFFFSKCSLQWLILPVQRFIVIWLHVTQYNRMSFPFVNVRVCPR